MSTNLATEVEALRRIAQRHRPANAPLHPAYWLVLEAENEKYIHDLQQLLPLQAPIARFRWYREGLQSSPVAAVKHMLGRKQRPSLLLLVQLLIPTEQMQRYTADGMNIIDLHGATPINHWVLVGPNFTDQLPLG